MKNSNQNRFTIGSFSVNNNVFLNIVLILVIVLGVFSINRLPKEQFSEIPFYFVNVIVPWPGVSAMDIEQSVTIKIETAMQGIDDLEGISSLTTEGLAQVTLEFDQDLDDDSFQRLFQEVQNRFTTVDLPDGTRKATIDDFSTNDFLPVIEVVLSGDLPFDTLNQAADGLQDKLAGINDVSSVVIVGGRDRQLLIEADPLKLEALAMDIDTITRSIQQQNVNVPAGTLSTESRDFLLRTTGQLQEHSDFKDIIIRKNPGSEVGEVTIGDVADVKTGYDTTGSKARFNGKSAITLRVAKVPGSSSIDIIQEVKDQSSDYANVLSDDIVLDFYNDSTVQIRDSLNVLVSNAIFGFLLLLVILFVFVGLRNALMTSLGIPVTFAITFVVLELMGETLNSNTLFGLVLVLGLIVDHAIVIAENSYRLQQNGLSRRQAAIQGVNQVIVPVVAATATTIAAFLPLTFLPGIIGKFLRVVPLTVTIALVASTLEAAFFIPSHYADWPGEARAKRRIFFESVQKWFRELLGVFYKHKLKTIAGMLLIMILVFSLAAFIEQDLFDSEDFTLFYIDIELAEGSPVKQTDEVVRQFEARLLPLLDTQDVVNISSFIGFSSGDDENITRTNVAQIIVDLAEVKEGRKRSISQIMQDVKELCSGIAGADSVQYNKAVSGPPQDPPVSFRVFGDSYEHLREASYLLTEKLKTYDQLFNVETNLDEGTPEEVIRVRPAAASRYGLSTFAVGQFIRQAFDGVEATTIFTDNEETPVIVRFKGGNQRSVSDVMQFKIPAPGGPLVPLSSIAESRPYEGIATIKRIDKKREVTVTAQAYSNEGLVAINRDIETLFAEQLETRYDDLRLSTGGEFAEFADTLNQILRVFLIGIFVIYTILATQFKSYVQPLLILVSVPFSFVGVILFLLIADFPLSTTVIYAGVALAGIAVNDTIVLISFINDLKKEGRATKDAILEAAVTRLRPILLTSLTTIAGLLPTAIGLAGRSVVWGPMAGAISFGLIFSTITALVIIPCLYGLFFDRKPKAIAA